jgi:hypothetical protein
MSKKPKWACANCGMYSSRRYSVKRHIQNSHGGGHYLPSSPPTYETKTTDSKIDYQKIMKEETLRGVIRKNLETL